MPILKNPKHERFAQALAKGEPASAAYVLAGYVANDGNAIRLKGNERISARVEEILGKAAQRTEVTVASITDRLLRIADKAEAEKLGASGMSVARAALMDVAKLNGLVIDRTTRELSEDQLNAILALVAANPGKAAELLAQLA